MRGIFGGRCLLRPYRANGCFVYLRRALPLVSLGRPFRACHTERSFLGIRVWFFYYAPTGLIRQAFFPAPHRSGFKLNFVSASWILLVGPFKLIAHNHKPRRGTKTTGTARRDSSLSSNQPCKGAIQKRPVHTQ